VTIVASCLAAEQLIAPCGGRLIEGYRRLRRGNGQLIELQSRKLGGDEIIVGIDMRQIRKAMRGGNGKLLRIVQARIEEPAFSVHFEVSHESVPVRYRPPADPGVEVHTTETKCGRNQNGAWHIRAGNRTIGDLLQVKCLSIQDQLGIEFSWTPTS